MEVKFQEMLSGCRVGSPDSIKEFVQEFYGSLLKVAATRLRDEDRAQDAVQGFLLTFLEKETIQDFRGNQVGQFRSFLLACLRNYINQQLRNSEEFDPTEFAPDLVPSNYPSAEDQFDKKSIRDLISQIDYRYRRVIDLELDYFKQREIAEILGLSIGTVSSYSKRAKEILFRLLRENGFIAIPFLLSVFLTLHRTI